MGFFARLSPGIDERAQYRALHQRFGELMSACYGTLKSDEVRAMSRRLDLDPWDSPLGDPHTTEVAIFDAAVFHDLRGGETAVARFRRNLPVDASELDHRIVDGWQGYRWSIFEICSINRGLKVVLRDSLDGIERTVWDLDLAGGARVGLRAAFRIVPIGDHWVTTGAAIGLDESIQALIVEHLPADMQEPARWPAWGTSERNRLILQLIVGLHAGPLARRFKIPSKGPCPCGSGKKFKHCCGKDRG